MAKIVSLGGLTLDLDSVKCFKVNDYYDLGKTNFLVVELKTTQVEYIFNPGTEEFELHKFSEVIEMEYPDNETARMTQYDWIDVWEEYLQEKEEEE